MSDAHDNDTQEPARAELNDVTAMEASAAAISAQIAPPERKVVEVVALLNGLRLQLDLFTENRMADIRKYLAYVSTCLGRIGIELTLHLRETARGPIKPAITRRYRTGDITRTIGTGTPAAISRMPGQRKELHLRLQHTIMYRLPLRWPWKS